MAFFEIVLVWEEDPKGKTKRGFTFYQPSPHGLKPVLSQRKRPLRFGRLDLALQRIKQDFPGYRVRIFADEYQGALDPDPKALEKVREMIQK